MMKRLNPTDRPHLDPAFEMVVADDGSGTTRSASPGAIYQACSGDLDGIAAVLRAADGTRDAAQLLAAFGARFGTDKAAALLDYCVDAGWLRLPDGGGETPEAKPVPRILVLGNAALARAIVARLVGQGHAGAEQLPVAGFASCQTQAFLARRR